MTVSPDALKKGDIISYKGNAAEVLSIRSWSDPHYGKVFGIDVVIKGKGTRVSFPATSQVEVWSGEAA